MPGDIEGHLSEKDGRLYVLDAARMFPPAAPIAGHGARVTLYKLLRPELVRSNAQPLSSDAFFRWGDPDNLSVHNREVEEATRRLLRHVIPAVVTELDGGATRCRNLQELELTMHAAGIHMRYLGHMYVLSSSAAVRRLLLAEMVARTFKVHLSCVFRELRMQTPDDFGHKATTLLNAVFLVSADAAPQFWAKEILALMRQKFNVSLDLAACTELVGDPAAADQLYLRIQELTGVVFRPAQPPTQANPFSARSLESIVPKIKVVSLPPPLSLYQYEAQYLQELRARERVLGTKSHAVFVNLLLGLARIYRWKREEERAQEFLQRALEISLQDVGFDPKRLLNLPNLAAVIASTAESKHTG